MKKFIAALAVALALCLCFAAVACAGGDVSEVGAWELEFFGDGKANYSVGDEYGGQTVTVSPCCSTAYFPPSKLQV